MSEFKCCLCNRVVDDEDIGVIHCGNNHACEPCVDELNEVDDMIHYVRK